jgi:hypothetical protein
LKIGGQTGPVGPALAGFGFHFQVGAGNLGIVEQGAAYQVLVQASERLLRER